MPNRLSRPTIAIAGAAAIGASLIGIAAVSQTSGPRTETRAVALTAGDVDAYLPDVSTFVPQVAEGFPPLLHVLQGTETWHLTDLETHQLVDIQVEGNDTQTTFGSFVNDDLLINNSQSFTLTSPSPYSEVDLMNFGGGFENEWASISNGEDFTVSDTVITPFGDYSIPLGTSPVPTALAGAALPVDALSGLMSSIDFNTTAAETSFGLAQTAFNAGEYPLAFSEALDGFNNLTLGVSDDVLVNGYITLTGGDEFAEFVFQNPGQPADLAVAFESAHEFLAQGQGLFSDAVTDFGLGNTVPALTELAGIGTDSTYASDAIILGLFDVLTGAAVSS